MRPSLAPIGASAPMDFFPFSCPLPSFLTKTWQKIGKAEGETIEEATNAGRGVRGRYAGGWDNWRLLLATSVVVSHTGWGTPPDGLGLKPL
jgi:hypothetical protein